MARVHWVYRRCPGCQEDTGIRAYGRTTAAERDELIGNKWAELDEDPTDVDLPYGCRVDDDRLCERCGEQGLVLLELADRRGLRALVPEALVLQYLKDEDIREHVVRRRKMTLSVKAWDALELSR